MRVGEYGVRFVFGTGFDMRNFTAVAIHFTKPDGTLLVEASPDVTVPSADLETTAGLFPGYTYAQYITQSGDIDQDGEWCAYVVYDDGSEHLISAPADFTVDPLGCQDG